MSKKGLSASEKRTHLESFFHTHKSFYLAKEIEKLAPKETGIRADVILEVLEDLVSDGLVKKEKIGIQNFFWSFPSDAHNTKRRLLASQSAALLQETEKNCALKDRTRVGQLDREKTSDREALLLSVGSKELKFAALQQKLKDYESADPVQLAVKVDYTRKAKEATNRWIGKLVKDMKRFEFY